MHYYTAFYVEQTWEWINCARKLAWKSLKTPFKIFCNSKILLHIKGWYKSHCEQSHSFISLINLTFWWIILKDDQICFKNLVVQFFKVCLAIFQHYIFVCRLATPRLTSSHFRSGNFSHPMLTTPLHKFWAEGHGEPCNKVSKHGLTPSWDWTGKRFVYNALAHYATLLEWKGWLYHQNMYILKNKKDLLETFFSCLIFLL